MTLTLAEARRIAGEVVAKEHPALEVLGATSAEGGSHYTEVILTARGGTTEPRRMVIGVDREASESSFRGQVSKQLRDQLVEHRQDR
jgi:hypothetical protein